MNNVSLLHETMYNYNKTRKSPYYLSEFALYSFLRLEIDIFWNSGDNFKKTLWVCGMVHLLDDENNIVTSVDFDCHITSKPEASAKVKHISQEWKSFGRS